MTDYNALPRENLKVECRSRGIIPRTSWSKEDLVNELDYSDRFANYDNLDFNGLQGECQREGISLSTDGWNRVVLLHALKSRYLGRKYKGWMLPDLKTECQARGITFSNSLGKDVLIEMLVDHVWRVEQGNVLAVRHSTLDPGHSNIGPTPSNLDAASSNLDPSPSNTEPGPSNLDQPAGTGEGRPPDDVNDNDKGVDREGQMRMDAGDNAPPKFIHYRPESPQG